MVYAKGQKVVVSCSSPYPFKRSINGHTCTINSIVPVGKGYCYGLEWRQEENPGRKCTLPMGVVLWGKDDFWALPYPELVVHSSGLPDI